jgi:hypothetical protein
MSALWPAHDPLPYRTIRIVDISPYRSSIRTPRSKPSNRRGRRAVAATAAVILALLVALTAIGAEPPAPGEFRLGPGHAMPPSLLS